MKKLLFLFLFLIYSIPAIHAQTHYYSIPAQNLTIDDPHGRTEPTDNYETRIKTVKISVKDMKISHLITLEEYKLFLNDQKNILPDTLFKKLLPNSTFFRDGTYKDYIEGNEYNTFPVVGVTWESAIEFCKWKTLNENEGICYMYRLPTQTEWLATKHFLKNNMGHDLGIYFSEWIFDEYEKQADNINHDLNPDYNDKEPLIEPFTVKRRLIMGKSSLYGYKHMNTIGITQFSDRSIAFLSFRCVKVKVVRNKKSEDLSESFEKDLYDPNSKIYKNLKQSGDLNNYHLLLKWSLFDKVRSSLDEDSDDPISKIKNAEELPEDKFDFTYHNNSSESDKKILKQYGEIKKGKKIGDWYYFNKEGILTHHTFYSDNGTTKSISLRNETDFKKKGVEKKKNFFEFVDSLKNLTEHKGEIKTDLGYSIEKHNKRLNGLFVFSEKSDVNIAGRYVDNLKTGTWCMWNFEGKLLLQRNYINGYEFDRIYTSCPQNKLTAILDGPVYKLKLNKDGYYNYYHNPDKELYFQNQIRRKLNPEDNPVLFNDDLLFHSILKHLKSGDINAYKGNSSNNFSLDTTTVEEVLKMYDPEKYDICSFITTEIDITDYYRVEREYRITEIAPIIKNKETGKEELLCWIHIPETRKFFAQTVLTYPDIPDYIKTLDDVFFFRYCGGEIYEIYNTIFKQKVSIDFIPEFKYEKVTFIKTEFFLWYNQTTDPT